MSPEYGATCGFFPVDDETLRYLRLTGRSDELTKIAGQLGISEDDAASALAQVLPAVVDKVSPDGQLPEGATATDLVLTVTEILRQTGVVGKFVEYFGEGLAGLPVADRATLGNMKANAR